MFSLNPLSKENQFNLHCLGVFHVGFAPGKTSALKYKNIQIFQIKCILHSLDCNRLVPFKLLDSKT